MAFEVLITNEAFEDLDSIAGFIRGQASRDVAQKWFDGIVAAIDSLREMPARCPLVGEDIAQGVPVRLLLFGRKNRAYKVYFRIRTATNSDVGSGTVEVFHVRHWARQAYTP